MAEKLAIYILQAPDQDIKNVLDIIHDIRQSVKRCPICHYFSEDQSCALCTNKNRNHSIICVVEKNEDIASIEKSGSFNGLYHILDGVLSPVDGISPSDINIGTLMNRIKKSTSIKEVIIATNPTVNGELTSTYLSRSLNSLKKKDLFISRIGFGIAIGSELSYVDKLTMSRSFQRRTQCH